MRVHTLLAYHYLNRYLAGHERLPFQTRILPSLLIHAMGYLHFLPMSLFAGRKGVFAEPNLTYEFFIDLAAFFAASIFTVKLYRQAAPQSRLWPLCYIAFLFVATWSYVLHGEANMYYPYDMMSLAFFPVGIYSVYAKRYALLVLVILFGTINRETTAFLVPLYVFDALAPGITFHQLQPRLRSIPWFKTFLLLIVWASVKFTLAYLFRNNDRSESFIRLHWNLRYLPPNNWPQLLSGCGFLLPVVWLMRRSIPDPRIATYTLLIPIWFFVMCFYGVHSKTRILWRAMSIDCRSQHPSGRGLRSPQRSKHVHCCGLRGSDPGQLKTGNFPICFI